MDNEDQLLRLLDALPEFEKTYKLRNRFNFFDAVDMSTQEIRHSRFLAFLLDPSGSHGLGDLFLRKVLTEVVGVNGAPPVTRLQVAVADLSEAHISCEKDHFDISIQIPGLKPADGGESRGLMFVIENKILSAESTDQLKKYRQRVNQRYPGYAFLGCFLTPDGYSGEDELWSSLSYASIAAILKSLLEDASFAPDVKISIEHYLTLIERKIVASQELIDACRRIYKEHRTAIDLIVENASESEFKTAFDEFLMNSSSLVMSSARPSVGYFLDKRWQQLDDVPRVASERFWPGKFPVLYWFHLSAKKLYLRLEVGPFEKDEGAHRNRLIALLREKIDGSTQRSTKAETVYTRIKTVSMTVSEDSTSEDLVKHMDKLWKDLGGESVSSAVVDAFKLLKS